MSQTPTGWIAPSAEPRQGSMRRFAIVGLAVLLVLLLVGYVGLTFLGAQVQAVLSGTVEFGTGPASACTVEGRATSFTSGTTVYTAAHLARVVDSGTAVEIRVLQDGNEVGADSVSFDTSGDCVVQSLSGAALTAGHYRVEYLAGTELLSVGEFDVIAP